MPAWESTAVRFWKLHRTFLWPSLIHLGFSSATYDQGIMLLHLSKPAIISDRIHPLPLEGRLPGQMDQLLHPGLGQDGRR